MKIIVTGGTGFLGRNIAERFKDEGHQVIATGRSKAIGDELRKRGIAFAPADLSDLDSLANVFTRADCVIHCAGKSGDWGSYDDFHEANVVGTRHVIASCKRSDIGKIIFVSTPSLYYTGKDRFNISESEKLPDRHASHYARTKRIAETELMVLANQGFKVIIFRPRALYGPYENTFIPRILRMAEKKRMPLINDGQALIDITYVDNFIDAVRLSLESTDEAWNEVYNISNDDPIHVRDWFAQVLQVFDRPFLPKNVPEPLARTAASIMELASHFPGMEKEPAMTRFSVGYMARSMTMSIDKARKKLNYSPRINNRQGFELYATWYRSLSCPIDPRKMREPIS